MSVRALFQRYVITAREPGQHCSNRAIPSPQRDQNRSPALRHCKPYPIHQFESFRQSRGRNPSSRGSCHWPRPSFMEKTSLEVVLVWEEWSILGEPNGLKCPFRPRRPSLGVLWEPNIPNLGLVALVFLDAVSGPRRS